MRFVQHATWPILSAFVLGCASPAPEPEPELPTPVATVSDAEIEPVVLRLVVVPPSADDYLCNDEAVTGSHQSREICKTRAQRAFERAQAQEWLRSGGYYGGGTNVSSARSARRTTRSAR